MVWFVDGVGGVSEFGKEREGKGMGRLKDLLLVLFV